MITQLPGFSDLVHDSQSTFRALLAALAQPGQINSITAQVTPPPHLTLACAAACLTLLDLDTQVWLQPSFGEQVKAWLLFHTGCRFTDNPQSANFAVIENLTAMPSLATFNQGTAEQPENSTTLLVQLPNWTGEQALYWRGPGILDQRQILVNLPPTFEQEWAANRQAYPLGIDIFFFTQEQVIGLPRTTSLERN